MTEAELTLALGAGTLAAVNPSGLALLPAYLSLLVLGDNIRRAVLLYAASLALRPR
jgi:cytochrome c-type biogenesis protein